jgi:hypothetical protein
MLIQHNGGRMAHVQNDIGRALIDAKLAVEVKPPAKKAPNTNWEICLGAAQDPPFIKAYCGNCGQPSFCGGQTAPMMKFLHCGIVETPPPATAKQYERQFQAWKNGEQPRPSSVSPAQRELEQKRLERLKAKRIIQI